MYKNLIKAMNDENITYSQIAELLGKRYQTISDTTNGVTKKGFYFEDACKIQKVFFPKYDIQYLFDRNDNELIELQNLCSNKSIVNITKHYIFILGEKLSRN